MCDRYTLIEVLKASKEPVKLKALVEATGTSPYALGMMLRALMGEGLVTKTWRAHYALTADGLRTKPPQEPEPVQTLECGHPRTSLHFCLKCHNEKRREYCKNHSQFLPTLPSQRQRVRS